MLFSAQKKEIDGKKCSRKNCILYRYVCLHQPKLKDERHNVGFYYAQFSVAAAAASVWFFFC